MSKYCGKCGARLDETTGFCPNCDADVLSYLYDGNQDQSIETDEDFVIPRKRQRERPHNSERSKRLHRSNTVQHEGQDSQDDDRPNGHETVLIVVLSLLIIFLVVTLAGLLIALFVGVDNIPFLSSFLNRIGLVSEEPGNAENASNGFVLLDNSFTDRKITDQSSALAAISDVAGQLGIEDVNAEFSECKSDTIFGNTYYRFYQEYKGIPVYGRSVVISADPSGNSLSLSGDYLDTSDLDISPVINEADAITIAQQYYKDTAIINSEGLSIYTLNDTSPELVWLLNVNLDNILINCFVSARTGAIINELVMTYSDAVEDTTRDICVYDAQNSTLKVQFVVIDSNQKIYEKNQKGWVDEQGNAVVIGGDSIFDIVVYDTNNNILGTGGEFAARLSTMNIFTQLEPADSSSPKAVAALSRVTAAYDFFEAVLKRHSFDDAYGAISICINDYKNYGLGELYILGDTNNAYSTGYYGLPITVLSFGTDNSLAVDVVAHEFTHSVERSISNMAYQSESGALQEAYSDIFGEIIEDWSNDNILNGDCDWVHNPSGSYPRNIITPGAETQKDGKSYPTNYKGENWVSTDDTGEANDYGGVHTNNTVISHAAYLMSRGITGDNPNFEALTTEDLAHLFYETLFKLPSDCTFSQFRTLVQNTADIMWKQGRLSYSKTRCVSNAFFQVGIDPAVMLVSKDGLSLDVYGTNGMPYENFTLYVRHFSGKEKKYSSKTVVKEGISFPMSGIYDLTIEDNANTDNRTTITVQAVGSGGTTRIPVFTQCGLSKIDGPITEPTTENISVESDHPAPEHSYEGLDSELGGYSEVLRQYKEAESNNFQNCGEYVGSSLQTLIEWGAKFNIYYSITDLNNDGIEELLIGAEDCNYGEGGISKVDLYTLYNNMPVRIVDTYSLGHRAHLAIFEDGTFAVHSSGGASTYMEQFFSLPLNSRDPTLIREFGTDMGEPYYCDEQGNRRTITLGELQRLSSMHDNPEMRISWSRLE